MTRDELWAKYQAGAPLSAVEEQDLAAGLRDDPEFRERFLRDVELDGMLRARERIKSDADDFERAFFRAWDAEHSATRFLKKVESRIREAGPSDRTPKPPTRRHRFRRRATGEWPSVFPLVAGVCFAFLAAFVLWRMVSSAQTPSMAVRPKPVPVPEVPIEIPARPEPPPATKFRRRSPSKQRRLLPSRFRIRRGRSRIPKCRSPRSTSSAVRSRS